VASNPHASALVVTAGFAEIAAGSIAMGLGGYLAARTDLEHYASEREREIRETVELPDIEIEEVAKVFSRLWTERRTNGSSRHRDYRKSKKLGGLHDAV